MPPQLARAMPPCFLGGVARAAEVSLLEKESAPLQGKGADSVFAFDAGFTGAGTGTGIPSRV